MTMEEDVGRRLRRFLVATLLMLVFSMTALGHIAISLRVRAAQERGYARYP